jgi:hypothetical protein
MHYTCVRCTYVALPIEVGAHALSLSCSAVVLPLHALYMCALHVRCSSQKHLHHAHTMTHPNMHAGQHLLGRCIYMRIYPPNDCPSLWSLRVPSAARHCGAQCHPHRCHFISVCVRACLTKCVVVLIGGLHAWHQCGHRRSVGRDSITDTSYESLLWCSVWLILLRGAAVALWCLDVDVSIAATDAHTNTITDDTSADAVTSCRVFLLRRVVRACVWVHPTMRR